MDKARRPFPQQRQQMVEQQLRARGVRDTAVLQAFNTVPRELFVPRPHRVYAYDDTPLPIPAGQTISQPYVVAHMLALLALRHSNRVLEVGTGSGYAAAVLSRIVAEVHTVERHQVLVDYARKRLMQLGYENVFVHHGDGTRGWPDAAPYNAIIVAAGGPGVPESLKEQLAVNGRLVIPVGPNPRQQRLILVKRTGETTYRQRELSPVAFVPLIGVEGWENA
ncbi:MAG: protein-L-isoaspartate(D-aspartate) O-methyltransferase [Ardenticatenaceae bacterium]|nr:protein-L-isoaspartate(D-aspartate) O-methyltransferase [Ardenticatenaceae bacterium]